MSETIKLLEGQEITGVKVMKLKTFLHNYSCMVNDINIVLIDCKSDYAETRIEIRNRKDFCDFIDTYGDSIVTEWMVCNGCGTPWIRFYLMELVKEEKPTVKPTTKEELIEIIKETIEKEGLNCDLNFIDVSLVEDMSCLFQESEFNGDISKWDVSKVKNMELMFQASEFNGDISNWDVSNVIDMCGMFEYSFFNGDISKWDVSKVKDMSYMFAHSVFNGDISKWDISNVKYKSYMFRNCTLEINLPEWYKF